VDVEVVLLQLPLVLPLLLLQLLLVLRLPPPIELLLLLQRSPDPVQFELAFGGNGLGLREELGVEEAFELLLQLRTEELLLLQLLPPTLLREHRALVLFEIGHIVGVDLVRAHGGFGLFLAELARELVQREVLVEGRRLPLTRAHCRLLHLRNAV